MTRHPPTRQEQKEATRALLLRVGRRVFTQHGFDATSIAMLCRAAKVTHGALYHHFPSKTELFIAVLTELTEEVARSVDASAASSAGWAQIEAACDAYLDACADPAFQAIVLRDGPRVLPADTFGAIDRDANEPLVAGLLQRWIAAGLLRPTEVTIVARMIGGALAEAGAEIAGAKDQRAARGVVREVILGWLGTLRPTRRT